ncbi:MAG: universal stress protein [Betaproteobacteria bacterium HGW-Betaproteobacteria-7]|jgi:nucleotide-binding universal stress UspA family protein|nr:MAG: universal stress protein [Betaproteobacteria bacterium HGW-Betaproteobacteria-7]
MTQHILAATDLSAPSRHAVDRAYRLAAERGWQLSLAHAIAPAMFDELQAMLGGGAPSIAETVAAEARQRLLALNDDPQRTRGVVADCQVLSGPPLVAIARHADESAADLLVLGARGEGFLRQLMLGSTASRLLRKTRHPVLVVKQPPHEAYRRALVAIDFSPTARAALRQVRKLVPNASLVLLHAVELPFEGKMQYANVDAEIIRRYRQEAQQEALRKLRQFAAEEGLAEPATRLLALPGRAARLILEQEQEEDCDLIVVGKHGLNMIEELLLGSTTKHVLDESQGDVLVAD